MNAQNIKQLSCQIELPHEWGITTYIEDVDDKSCAGIQFHSKNHYMQQAFDAWIESERVKDLQLQPVLGVGCSLTDAGWTFWTIDAIDFVLANYPVFTNGIDNKNLRRHVESIGVSVDTPDELSAL